MKPYSEKTNVTPYLQQGYKYVLLSQDAMYELYCLDFFKTKKRAEHYNEEKMRNFGDVYTIRQAIKKFPFIIKS